MGLNQFVGWFLKASLEGVTLPRFGFSSDTVLSPILSNLLLSVVLCTVEMPPYGGIAFCIYMYPAYKEAKHTSRHRTGAGRTSENPLSAKFGEYPFHAIR
jgi:hypothetical protein